MGHLTEALERIIQFYEATNQPEKARAWRAQSAPVVQGEPLR
jgi:hypothetical protein